MQYLSHDFVRNLITDGLVLVIIDRFSERSLEEQNSLDPRSCPLYARKCIITTRESDFRPNEAMQIRPTTLDYAGLVQFTSYCLSVGQCHSQDQLRSSVARIQETFKQREFSIPVGLAAMFIECEVFGNSLGSLSGDAAGVMFRHIARLCDRKVTDMEVGEHMLDLQAVAWESLKGDFQPQPIEYPNLLVAIQSRRSGQSSNQTVEEAFCFMLEKMRVIEVSDLANRRYRIRLDIVAEYLAAMHVVRHLKEESNHLNFYEHLMACASKNSKDGQVPSFYSMIGFLYAVADLLNSSMGSQVPEERKRIWFDTLQMAKSEAISRSLQLS